MTIYIKVEGAWKQLDPRVKVDGSWKNVDNGWVKISGEWKEFYNSISSLFSVTVFPYEGNTTVVTSTDFITWTLNTVGSAIPFSGRKDAIFNQENNIYVLIGNGIIFSTSTNGTTWTARTMPVSASWINIEHGNNIFVAIANSSFISATSTNGISWTQTTLPASSRWASVTYGNGVFVAVSGALQMYGGTSSNISAYSTNGITWQNATMPATVRWSSVAYGNNIFLAVDSYSRGRIAAVSTNGISWTQTISPQYSGDGGSYWHAISYGNGKFFVTPYARNMGGTTTDGITWQATTLPHPYSGGLVNTAYACSIIKKS